MSRIENDRPDVPRLAGLVARARGGDAVAMEELAARALTRARTVTRVLLDRQEALDVAQDAVIDALRGLPKLRDPELFDEWVTRIAARRVLKARRRAYQRPPALSLEHPGVTESLAAPGETIDAATARELRDALRVGIKTLPRDQGVAIALRYLFDFTEDQVADALGKKTSAASMLLVRARQTLARHPAIASLAPPSSEGPT
jgi:RNA polymerase sigma factor (sigma-70 family)